MSSIRSDPVELCRYYFDLYWKLRSVASDKCRELPFALTQQWIRQGKNQSLVRRLLTNYDDAIMVTIQILSNIGADMAQHQFWRAQGRELIDCRTTLMQQMNGVWFYE